MVVKVLSLLTWRGQVKGDELGVVGRQTFHGTSGSEV